MQNLQNTMNAIYVIPPIADTIKLLIGKANAGMIEPT